MARGGTISADNWDFEPTLECYLVVDDALAIGEPEHVRCHLSARYRQVIEELRMPYLWNDRDSGLVFANMEIDACTRFHVKKEHSMTQLHWPRTVFGQTPGMERVPRPYVETKGRVLAIAAHFGAPYISNPFIVGGPGRYRAYFSQGVLCVAPECR